MSNTEIILASVVDPNTRMNGYTQADLGDMWHQTMVGTPVPNNPLPYDDNSDPNGAMGSSARASATRVGSIQYLVGWTATAPLYETPDLVERTITIPGGSSLFFPMTNIAWLDWPLADGTPEPGINEPGGPTEQQLRKDFDDWASITTPFAFIDGVEVPNPEAYLQRSEDIFYSAYADPNLVGMPVPPDGLTSAQISAGFWLGLMPLSPETHTLRFGGLTDYPAPSNDFLLDVTYTISYDLNEINGNRHDNRCSVQGTNRWDEIHGHGGNDYIVGKGGNDALHGDRGNDTLIGVDPNRHHPGRAEIDILWGGEGRDKFVLGDRHHAFYVGQRLADYAIIKDFSREDDVIQLAGRRGSYQLREDYTLGGRTGTAIMRGCSELVAFVDGATNLSLRSNDFAFVC